jgi:excisionase family DNA binding protein
MSETAQAAPEKWLRPGEVAALIEEAGLFRVSRSALRDWTEAGRIAAHRTIGGHRRYRESDVRALLAELEAVA